MFHYKKISHVSQLHPHLHIRYVTKDSDLILSNKQHGMVVSLEEERILLKNGRLFWWISVDEHDIYVKYHPYEKFLYI